MHLFISIKSIFISGSQIENSDSNTCFQNTVGDHNNESSQKLQIKKGDDTSNYTDEPTLAI